MTEYTVEITNGAKESLADLIEQGEIVQISPDGNHMWRIKKQLVDRVNGLKIEVFSNEHPPPHFRVKYQSSTANYRIDTCEMLNGSGEVTKFNKNIKVWWAEHKQDIIDAWNNCRPDDCPVGKYVEEKQ